ncbi:hypothetical protein BV378_28240 [Nostoc sp. RF31YmG]|nr:hypothetical protein BV378_28240 [Nostoc sp. RF31YmG]
MNRHILSILLQKLKPALSNFHANCKLNHIYFKNHSFKSSGSILLPAGSSGQDARTTPGFKMDEV